ncbi:hypothetical protein F383_12414 [Gossypium arboreum]|uniref:Uncharacterized protein n=1 Tax=Gossypium arboreum TaxID=29729 RepID=A0A0B0NDA8_GOSAR|nr:hypothetical protein F383_12414 [Gossypium arboreum]
MLVNHTLSMSCRLKCFQDLSPCKKL